MIGHPPAIKKVYSQMEDFKVKIQNAYCILGEEDGGQPNDAFDRMAACENDLKRALEYVQSLEVLMTHGEINSTEAVGIYARGYSRLIKQLQDSGFKFLPTGVVPADSNICLSMLDQLLPSDVRTKTRELDKIANCVSRAMIYGETADRRELAEAIDRMVDPFVAEWVTEEGDSERDRERTSQEAVFLRALALLLREGVAAAESAITYFDTSSEKFGESNITGTLSEVMTIMAPPLRLFDPYLNAFQRIVSLCLKDLSARSWTVPQDEEVLGTFSQWEQSLRRNITASIWDPNPAELVGQWEMMDIQGRGELDPFMSTEGLSNGDRTQTGSSSGNSNSDAPSLYLGDGTENVGCSDVKSISAELAYACVLHSKKR